MRPCSAHRLLLLTLAIAALFTSACVPIHDGGGTGDVLDSSLNGTSEAPVEEAPVELDPVEFDPVDEDLIEPEDEPQRRPPAQLPNSIVVYEGPSCTVEFLTTDFPGNRGDSIPAGTLNVVLFYDGDAASEVEVRLGLTDGGQILIGRDAPGGVIDKFGEQIETRVYRTSGCTISGDYEVEGVVPDGVIDGLAIGVLDRDAQGLFRTWQSSRSEPVGRADFVGMWPLGFSNETFSARTPQITDGYGRETAQALIIGAQLVGNGSHRF